MGGDPAWSAVTSPPPPLSPLSSQPEGLPRSWKTHNARRLGNPISCVRASWYSRLVSVTRRRQHLTATWTFFLNPFSLIQNPWRSWTFSPQSKANTPAHNLHLTQHRNMPTHELCRTNHPIPSALINPAAQTKSPSFSLDSSSITITN